MACKTVLRVGGGGGRKYFSNKAVVAHLHLLHTVTILPYLLSTPYTLSLNTKTEVFLKIYLFINSTNNIKIIVQNQIHSYYLTCKTLLQQHPFHHLFFLYLKKKMLH